MTRQSPPALNSRPARAAPVRRPKDRGEFNRRVYEIVRAIPPGRVMTYGGVAALIPAPRSVDPVAYRRVRARWVGYALAKCGNDLPWQRVVNAQGRISPRLGEGPPVQRVLLEDEGVAFDPHGVLDLAQYAWSPSTLWLHARGLAHPTADI
jgi:methylated-DNA-protein-cysteine methyltransferase-like protein